MERTVAASSRYAKKESRCKRCKVVFASHNYLSVHLRKNRCFFRATDKERYKCPYCDAHFVAVKTLEKHIRRVHSVKGARMSSKCFPCEACPYIGQSREAIKEHRRRHARGDVAAARGGGRAEREGRTRGEMEEEDEASGVFVMLKSAHRGKMARFRFFLADDVAFLNTAFASVLPHLVTFLRESMASGGGNNLKMSLVLSVEMVQLSPKDGSVTDSIEVPLRSTLHTLRNPRDVVPAVSEAFGEIENTAENFVSRGSGWVLNDIYHFDVELYRVPPLVGACHLHDVTYNGGQLTFNNPPLAKCEPAGGRSPPTDPREEDCFYLAVARGILGPTAGSNTDALRAFIRDRLCQLPPPRSTVKGGHAFMRECDIGVFEKAHEDLRLSINVVYENEEGQIFPLRSSPVIAGEGVTSILLMLSYFTQEAPATGDETVKSVEVGHYALMENPSLLLGKRGVGKGGRHYAHSLLICYNCFNSFYRQSTYDAHVRWCHAKSGQVVKMPHRGERVSFQANEKTFLSAYSVVYDFETRPVDVPSPCSCPASSRRPMTREEKEEVNILLAEGLAKKKNLAKPCPHKTQVLSEQRAFAFCYAVVDRHGKVVEMDSYVGDDAAAVFVRKLLDLENRYLTRLRSGGQAMSAAEEKKAGRRPSQDSPCYLCSRPLGSFKAVRDHDHVSGEFLGWAHDLCNLRRRENMKLPVFAHNASGFDAHLIMRELSSVRADIDDLQAIPLNTQKFKVIYLNSMVLMDSMAFLPFSLDALTDTLRKSRHDFPLLRQWSRLGTRGEEAYAERLEAASRKGVFCYDYAKVGVEAMARERGLPPKEAFFNVLTQAHISDEEYAFAGRVFELFECSSLLDYATLYMEVDVLLLAEAITNMRNILYKEFGLDMTQYLSMPMMARDLMLKSTGESLELISDYDMVLMLQRGLRGGVSYIGQRLAELDARPTAATPAPSPPTDEYETSRAGSGGAKKESIAYVDANNLYGTSMQRALPYDGYQWMTQEELASFDPLRDVTEDDDATGYILEVDLHYPEHLHLAHNSFPLAPDQEEITQADLSPYAARVLAFLKGRAPDDPLPSYKAKKLTATFRDRREYVVHGVNLKYYVEKGLKVTAVRRGIKFRQKKFLRAFIAMCTEKRRLATTKAESDLWKLIVNSLYGKSIENTDKRMDCRFNFGDDVVDRRVRCPTFKGSVICDDDFSVTFHRKKEVRMVQFWAWGFSVLELSKVIMQKLYYEAIRPAFDDQVAVLMSDTDSFCLLLGHPRVNEGLARIANVMDFSNYPPDHPLFDASRKNQLGYLKNEVPGNKPILRFAGVKPKSYGLSTLADACGDVCGGGGREAFDSRAKGVKKVVKKSLTFDDYKSTVLGAKEVSVTQYGLQAVNYVNRVLRTNKVAFSSFYDQRWTLCPVHTCPYGSVLIRAAQDLGGDCPVCRFDIYV
jgi:hypothetical protein